MKNDKYPQNFISNKLKKYLDFSPKNLKDFINELNRAASSEKKYTKLILIILENRPFASTEVTLKKLEKNLRKALFSIDVIYEECFEKYELTKRQKKMLLYIRQWVEDTWAKIDQLLVNVTSKNKKLTQVIYGDYRPLEFPESINLEEILKIDINLN